MRSSWENKFAAEVECELCNRLAYLDEIGQALGNVIEQLRSGTNHNTLWDGVDLWLHLEVVLALEMDEEDAEVCAAQVESQELAAF